VRNFFSYVTTPHVKQNEVFIIILLSIILLIIEEKKIIPFSLLKKKLHKLISSVKTTKKPNQNKYGRKSSRKPKVLSKKYKKTKYMQTLIS